MLGNDPPPVADPVNMMDRGAIPSEPNNRKGLRGADSVSVIHETSLRPSRGYSLRSFTEKWQGTPHRMGGNSHKGIDCSGLVIKAYDEVYDHRFSGRRAIELYAESTPIRRSEIREGDLVFFKIKGRKVDHVGISLGGDEFVHVSSSRGVMISRLSEKYFDQRFFRAARPKP